MITIIAGTNRKNSVTLKVAKYYEKLLNETGEVCQVLDLTQLPKDFVFSSLYGVENDVFINITEQFIFKPSKFIIITPEYNGSFPGVMKAFIDGWDPRRVNGKWAALVGVSSGRQGNARGMDDWPLQQVEFEEFRIFRDLLVMLGITLILGISFNVAPEASTIALGSLVILWFGYVLTR